MACGEERFAEELPPDSVPVGSSAYVVQGGELSLSNSGQLELLLAMRERGAPLRTMVRGFSMNPFLRDGDVLTISTMLDTLRIGDIVAFRHPRDGRLAIHRLVRRTKKGWLAWGDNCPEPDGEVAPGDILGRVILVERNGRRAYPWLGRAGALIASLNSSGMLVHVRRVWRLPRRVASFLLRRLQGLSVYHAVGRRLAARAIISIADQHDSERLRIVMRKDLASNDEKER